MSQVYTSSTIPLSFDNQHEGNNVLLTGDNSVDGDNEGGEKVYPIINCILAGGLGGIVGDSSMHSLDTVKTRQQGFVNNIKYKNMISAYVRIFREEGFFRGLYGGYTPALLGSFPSTAVFFGTYELSKRLMIDDFKLNDTFAYFVAGILGDFASSVFYVPSEVLKTRLQLQGRHNNPYTKESGYNYRGLFDAIRSIAKNEGMRTFVFGYKETLFRDLPFSALQFAFYERFRRLAIFYNGSDKLPIISELGTGAAAGGLAGFLTTPLDVIKTRIQTSGTSKPESHIDMKNVKIVAPQRFSTLNALSNIYKTEGIVGLFSGVGPRSIWTGIQSSIMLLLYQVSLRKLDHYMSEGRLQN